MVAKATNRKAVPVYEAPGFRGAETVGALQAAVMIALATEARTAADLSRAGECAASCSGSSITE